LGLGKKATLPSRCDKLGKKKLNRSFLRTTPNRGEEFCASEKKKMPIFAPASASVVSGRFDYKRVLAMISVRRRGKAASLGLWVQVIKGVADHTTRGKPPLGTRKATLPVSPTAKEKIQSILEVALKKSLPASPHCKRREESRRKLRGHRGFWEKGKGGICSQDGRHKKRRVWGGNSISLGNLEYVVLHEKEKGFV